MHRATCPPKASNIFYGSTGTLFTRQASFIWRSFLHDPFSLLNTFFFLFSKFMGLWGTVSCNNWGLIPTFQLWCDFCFLPCVVVVVLYFWQVRSKRRMRCEYPMPLKTEREHFKGFVGKLLPVLGLSWVAPCNNCRLTIQVKGPSAGQSRFFDVQTKWFFSSCRTIYRI